MERLRETYQKEIMPSLKKEFNLDNDMAAPRIEKLVVNAGVGEFRDNKEALESFMQDLAQIASQKPHITRARKSEAGFNIRKGDIVGTAVTLRGDRMWAFLDKLINIALPRVRDFRGLNPNAFDKAGNYSLGIREHTIFPEVNPNTVKGIRTLQVTVVMKAKEKEHSKALLDKLGMPFWE